MGKLKKIEISEFEITFYQKNSRPFVEVVRKSSSKGHYISDFLEEFNNIDDISEDLIDVITPVIDGEILNEVICAGMLCSFVEEEKTYFIKENDLSLGKIEASKDERKNMETKLFKEITLLWLDYITTL